ncbi:MAG: C4-dicarboxylate ABC transporter substrate-binding protein, partial [Paraglaciecola sp.]
MKITKILITALFLSLVFTSLAHAQTTMYVASWLPPSHPQNTVVLATWGKWIEEATNGEVKLKIEY